MLLESTSYNHVYQMDPVKKLENVPRSKIICNSNEVLVVQLFIYLLPMNIKC